FFIEYLCSILSFFNYSFFSLFFFFFFFNATPTTEIYTLSLHDALPILYSAEMAVHVSGAESARVEETFAFRELKWDVGPRRWSLDRKSTRLNSSHRTISYAVFCLKKKKKKKKNNIYSKKIQSQ